MRASFRAGIQLIAAVALIAGCQPSEVTRDAPLNLANSSVLTDAPISADVAIELFERICIATSGEAESFQNAIREEGFSVNVIYSDLISGQSPDSSAGAVFHADQCSFSFSSLRDRELVAQDMARFYAQQSAERSVTFRPGPRTYIVETNIGVIETEFPRETRVERAVIRLIPN
ncbi:MAG: hypothetical protein AAF376_16015 [Pseudomonadota bacterium]